MGFAPGDVDRMSLWEFLACQDGYAAAHGKREAEAPADEEFDRAVIAVRNRDLH